MPVTGKLSRDFYDRFGDKVVDELVGLLNDMDATFRTELRDLNERNFQRFEAELRGEMSALRTEVQAALSEFRTEVHARFAESQADGHTRFTEVHREIGSLRTQMADLKAELIKWMFLFWLGTVATMLGVGRLLV